MRKDSELTDSDKRVLGYTVRNRAVFLGEVVMNCQMWFDEAEATLKNLRGQGLIRADHIKDADPAVDIFTPTISGIEFAERSHGI